MLDQIKTLYEGLIDIKPDMNRFLLCSPVYVVPQLSLNRLFSLWLKNAQCLPVAYATSKQYDTSKEVFFDA